METSKWKIAILLIVLLDLINSIKSEGDKECPSQELILPCRCLLRNKDEFQIWCSHSDLPRVLEGLRAVSQHIYHPIDELILENNNLPSLPGKAFLQLKVMRLMLRYNSLERVSNGWLVGLEDSLMELFIVEPDLRGLPDESLHSLNVLEAVTIQTNLMKRLPNFSALPKLRYLQIESLNLVELSPRNFRNLPSLQKFHVTGSPRLDRLEAGLLQDLPRLALVNISYCGISWVHLRSITRLPSLLELSLVGNKINDAGMIGRGSRDLPALEIIRLDYNDIDKLSEAAFVDLPSLKKLFLSHNHITELHHGAFHRVPLLRTLDLNHNHVRRVHPESFLQHSGSGLEELWLIDNDIAHIAELRSLLDALPRLTFLEMSYNNLDNIPFGALRGHPTLERLHLDYNKINLIERDAFMAMPALRELRLKNNSLTDRLDTPLWNLPALKGLDLSGNYFRRLEPRFLTNIPSLRKVDFSGNDISVVDPASFLMTPDLEHINLSNNALASLHPATFRHLVNLYDLDVSYNGLIDFVPGLPRGIEYLHMAHNLIGNIPPSPSPDLELPSLRMLDVSSNGIQRLHPGSLRTIPQLRRLYIGKNALQQLGENSFTGLNHLEVLDLHNNRISKIHPSALKEMSQLLELNLCQNRLDLLVPDILKGIPNLKKLDISKNQLTEILQGTFESTRDLEIIDASRNSLVNLPPGLYGMKNLKVLDLTDNRLKNIHPDTLSSLVSLEELRMSKNFVQELRRGAFNNLPNLKVLHLDNNELTALETRSIYALPSLKSIKLSQNKLIEIPNAAFSELPSLQMLELQENELRLISSTAFQQVPHLLMLNLSLNHIVGLEDAGLRSLRSLEMLDLSHNQLAVVSSPSLEKMEWLVELRLDNNKICSVSDATFNGMPRLRVLSLKNNKMMSFPEQAVQKLRGNIAVLDIDGNPLACSCSILWLRAWLQESSVMGPRCLDGSLLREIRLSRQECEQEEKQQEPVAPGCESELLTGPGNYGTSQIFSQQWLNLRDNRTKLNIGNKNHLAPLPEESDYFYDEYVDYPYNETAAPHNNQHIKEGTSTGRPNSNSSHYTSGDTPVIYAAASKNKTKIPDTPKGVVGSPSSSGFTFFGVPLPSINLNNILGVGGNLVRMDDKRKSAQPPLETINAERKTAIVNHPSRQDFNMQLKNDRRPNQFQAPPPDLPERHTIIGMHPPSHPKIETGGFVPVLPGSIGGFTPIIPDLQITKRNFSTSANIERVNLTQQGLPQHSTSPPNFDPTNLPQSTPSYLSKRGPYPSIDTINPPKPVTTEYKPTIISTTSTTTEKQLIIESDKIDAEYEEDGEASDEEEDAEEDIAFEETKEDTTARVQEVEQIKNISQILGVKPTGAASIETSATGPGFETFEDIFKEVVENVSIPITSAGSLKPVTESNIENLQNFNEKDNSVGDLITSYTNNENKKAENTQPTEPNKKDIIGTPLSALLVPGGQQPQFRPAGRPVITKVQNPHSSGSSSLQGLELSSSSVNDEDITPLAHNREGKHGFLDGTSQTTTNEDDESMNWYFANYNKTNLEPYIGNGMYPTSNKAQDIDVYSISKYVMYIIIFKILI